MLACVGLTAYYLAGKITGLAALFKRQPGRLLIAALVLALAAACVITRSALTATLLYTLMLLAGAEAVRLIARLAGSGKLASVLASPWALPVAAGLALIITLAGWLVARNPVLKEYTIELDKAFGDMGSISIVMLSDLHMGTGMLEGDLDRMINHTNAQNADIICLTGDIFDEITPQPLREATIIALAGLKAAYGVYYVSGNHDPSFGDAEAALLEASGVKIVDNRCLLINGCFYIAGRADGGHGGQVERKDLAVILADIDKAKPLIVLDHRPGEYEHAQLSGTDLQLSGHTHAGQLFPFGIVSKWANKVNYGLMQTGGFSLIVSSGYGVWGFPVRTSGFSEYVKITLIPAAREQ